jgi:hypothetical protein
MLGDVISRPQKYLLNLEDIMKNLASSSLEYAMIKDTAQKIHDFNVRLDAAQNRFSQYQFKQIISTFIGCTHITVSLYQDLILKRDES